MLSPLDLRLFFIVVCFAIISHPEIPRDKIYRIFPLLNHTSKHMIYVWCINIISLFYRKSKIPYDTGDSYFAIVTIQGGHKSALNNGLLLLLLDTEVESY